MGFLPDGIILLNNEDNVIFTNTYFNYLFPNENVVETIKNLKGVG